MFREIRISSLGLPEKLSVPSEKADFGRQQKQGEQLLVFSFSTAFVLESNQGTKPSCSSFCWGTGWATAPRAHPEDTGTPDSTSSGHKVPQKGEIGSQTLPVCPKREGRGAAGESEGVAVTKSSEQPQTPIRKQVLIFPLPPPRI